MSNYDEAIKLAKYIKDAKKVTPVKLYLKGNLKDIDFSKVSFYGNGSFGTIFGDYSDVVNLINNNKDKITSYDLENDRRNSAIPLLDLTNINARIEPGALIRDQVTIGDNAVIMMGAVINIGAKVGSRSMIDMNAVLGARAEVGINSHVGAGAILAGVLEPPSASPVIVGDNCLIGANAVVLEGVKVGNGAIVAAGSIVTKDVPENAVVAGVPARILKYKDSDLIDKTKILDELRD